jgi:hypothetical protein
MDPTYGGHGTGLETFDTTRAGVGIRKNTTATVQWFPDPGLGLDAQSDTPDISSIVQEIVNSPEWTYDDPIILMLESQNSPPGETQQIYLRGATTLQSAIVPEDVTPMLMFTSQYDPNAVMPGSADPNFEYSPLII